MRSRDASAAGPIPASAGIGLRFPHHDHVLTTRPQAAWFEVHPENYMTPGAPREALESIRADYPISLHAVGLSLGSVDNLDNDHLERLADLVRRIQPGLVSEHLSWSTCDGTFFADLLPLPYTEEALNVVARNVHAVQESLGRQLLIENPSRYLEFTHATLSETEFLTELARRTGCGLLCDVNNIYVSAHNLGFDAAAYLDALPSAPVAEIHLAGHAVESLSGGTEICIDDHSAPVAPAVWQLYERAVARFGAVPTLIEWDTNISTFDVLQHEARKAQSILKALAHAEDSHACAA